MAVAPFEAPWRDLFNDMVVVLVEGALAELLSREAKRGIFEVVRIFVAGKGLICN